MDGCICGPNPDAHVSGCVLAKHKPHVFRPRLNSTEDPWSWEVRGIPNPDKGVSR